MIFLQTEIITPTFGLFFWSVIIFLLFFFILRRYAWKPIIDAVNERDHRIESSLKEAEIARQELVKLKSDNEALLKEARSEREKILREANTMKDQIINDAKQDASKVANQEIEKARIEIEAQKLATLNEIKSTAGNIAVDIAEKILRKEFSDRTAQESFAQRLISELDNQLEYEA